MSEQNIYIIVTREFVAGNRLDTAIVKIKYAIYRPEPGRRIMTPAERAARIYDRGLGTEVLEIAQALQERKSAHVGMWIHVISPAPRVFQLVPGQERALIAELSDLIMQDYFAAMGFEIPRYTTIVHDAIDAATGLHRFHGHVISPGKGTDLDTGAPRAVYIRKEKGHFDLMDKIREAALDTCLTRRIGPDWQKHIPPLPGSQDDWDQQMQEPGPARLKRQRDTAPLTEPMLAADLPLADVPSRA